MVKQFRRGQVSKAETILEIQANLTSGETANSELISALSSYIGILDDIVRSARKNQSKEGGLRPLESQDPLKVPPQPQNQSPLLTRFHHRQTLRLTSFLPHPTPDAPGDITQRTQSPRKQKKGQRSSIGALSTRFSSPGRVPQQSFEPNLSLKSSSGSTSLMTQLGIGPYPLLPGRFSSVLLRISRLSPSLSRGVQSTLPKFLEAHYTSDVKAKPSQDLGDLSSSSPFESSSSAKPSPTMGTGSLPLGGPSKRSLSPCQIETPRHQ